MRELEKHRYVYFLGNKKENKLFISKLKYQKLTYPKVGDIEIEITKQSKRKKGFMSNSLWVEKYRPNTLENYIGNEHLKSKVENYLNSGDLPHLLLYGRGTGKTTLKIISK